MNYVLDLRKCLYNDEGRLVSGELILKTRLVCSFDFSKETEQICYPKKIVFDEEKLIIFSKQQKTCIAGSVENLIRYISAIKLWKKEISKNLKKGWKRFYFAKGEIENEEIYFTFASKRLFNNEEVRKFFIEKTKENKITNSKVVKIKELEELENLITFKDEEED